MRTIISAILRLIVVVCATWGIAICAFDADSFMGGKAVWLYFTIQSNVWVALCLLIGLIYQVRRRQPGRWYHVVQLVTTIAITLTGVVFCFILAPTIEGEVWTLSNLFTHIIVPLASFIDYFVVMHDFDLRYRDALYGLVPPLYYLGFASVGYVLNWQFSPGCNYPYFFLNWGSPAGAFGFSHEMPWMGVMYYVVIVFIVLWLLGLGLVACSRISKQKQAFDVKGA